MEELRKKQHLTQIKLGEMVGLSQSMISHHERGRKVIADMATLHHISEILQCRIADIAEPIPGHDPEWYLDMVEVLSSEKITDSKRLSRIFAFIDFIRSDLSE